MQPLRISFTIKSQQFESWRISRSSTSRIEGERGEGEREGREGGERGGEEEGEREKVFKVIYKKGDDLRQDQVLFCFVLFFFFWFIIIIFFCYAIFCFFF